VTILLPLLAFAFGSIVVTALTYAFKPKPTAIDARLRDVVGGQQAPASDANASPDQIVAFLKRMGERAPKSIKELSKLQLRLVQAGYRGGEAVPVFLGIRVGCALAVFALCMMPLLMRPNLSMALSAMALAYVVPGMVLARKAKKRQHRIRLSLADALDLLVVSVEAGLGLDQGMRKVSEELKDVAPKICEELQLCNMQLQMGRPRREVLHDLGVRTGVDDVRSLAAILIQADRFGSSIAQALRVQSDAMRTRRRQLAEEKAAQVAVKLIFPLVLFIFPAIFVVLVGPAAIQIQRNLLSKS